MTKSKTTVIALAALVVVCVGSFLGVRALNQNTKVQQPVTITTQQITTTVPTTTQPSTEPTTVPTQPSTAATTGLAVIDAEKGSTSNLFTTFAQSTTIPPTTTTAPTTTTKPATTAAPTTTKALTGKEDPEEVIKSAAVFSDGFLGYKYDPEGDVYYTNKDPWQRNFGFNELYDVGASFIVFYYDTMRCKFNYAGKDWMIQFWKG